MRHLMGRYFLSKTRRARTLFCMTEPDFTPIDVPIGNSQQRHCLRAFVAERLSDHAPQDLARSWSAWDEKFSHDLGDQGYIGTTWPVEYGGRAAGQLERYLIIEELLAAGAPVAAHWFADRQTGAMLLRYGSEEQRQKFLPSMAAGEIYCCIGMSEPGSGSDLASLKTTAEPRDGGWTLNGSKIWTTYAHKAHLMVALVRTNKDAANPRAGLSQFLVEMDMPGVTVQPIRDQMGDAHFAEVFFDDVFVPDNMMLGKEGEGWAQVNAELALERSGPERFLSSYRLIEDSLMKLDAGASRGLSDLVAKWCAELWVLRQMSLSVAAKSQRGENPMVEASIVKDLGARFEQSVPDDLQACWDARAFQAPVDSLMETLFYLKGAAASFSLRGGTSEILRGIIAKGVMA